jgi:hypothetical protein
MKRIKLVYGKCIEGCMGTLHTKITKFEQVYQDSNQPTTITDETIYDDFVLCLNNLTGLSGVLKQHMPDKACFKAWNSCL